MPTNKNAAFKVELNSYQKDLLNILANFTKDLNKKSIYKIFSKRRAFGIYIHGSTGSGKTMLLQSFYSKLTVAKKFVHYQEFIQETHKTLHEKNMHSRIDAYAKELSKGFKVLCMDEIEIKDIADAMLIGRLFKYLFKYKVFIAATSNTPVNDLYKDGLQRELFLPFIKIMNDHLVVHNLKSNVDYRTINVSDKDKIVVTKDHEARKIFTAVVEKLIQGKQKSTKELKFFGRNILFNNVYGDILIVSFVELCKTERSSVDYINICKAFHIIVLLDVPVIEEAETEIAIRLINFIDNAYFNKVKLYMNTCDDIEKIYQKGARHFEFLRTISRIKEMASENW